MADRDRFEEAIEVMQEYLSDSRHVMLTSKRSVRNDCAREVRALDLAIEALREKQQREKEKADG